MKKSFKQIAVIIGALILGLGSTYIYAATFTEPACAPTGCNTSAPIDVSAAAQSKTGGLTLSDPTTGILTANGGAITGALVNNGGSVLVGNVGVGTTSVAQKMTVDGNLNFTGALMTRNSAGALGTVMLSQGAKQSPIWVATSSLGFSNGGSGGNGGVSGTVGTLSKFITASSVGNSIVTEVGPNVIVGSGAGAIQIGGSDATPQGMWIRNDTANPVISTKTGDMFMGYQGRAGMTWRFGSGGTGALFANDMPANSFTINSSGYIGVGKASGSMAGIDVSGQVRVDGPSAGIIYADRSTNRQWQLYGTSDSFRLYNGGGDALTIDPSGNITAGAIGTAGSLPSDKPAGWAGGVSTYDVVAKASVRANQFCIGGGVNSTTPGSCITAWPTGGSGGVSGTLNYLAKFTPNGTTAGNSQIYDDGTNVGVGNTIPGAKLDVTGNVKATQFCLPGTNPTGGCISTWPVSGGSGTVGPGTVNKVAKFTPNGATVGDSIITDNGTNVNIGTVGSAKATLTVNGQNGDAVNIYAPSDNHLAIQTTLDDNPLGVYGGGQNQLSLQPLVGNVGIGTLNPIRTLDVKGIIRTTDGSPTGWNFWGGTNLHIGNDANYQGSPAIFIQGSDQNVGINITNPDEKLTVTGNIKASGQMISQGIDVGAGLVAAGFNAKNTGVFNMAMTGGALSMYNPADAVPGGNFSLTILGSANASAYYYNSDKRLKNNINNIDSTDALSKIIKLQGVTFNWNADNRKDVGLIAQDVEKVFPDVVKTNSDGYKSVEYGNLIAPLIESVKAQQKEIDALKKEIQSLKNK